MWSKLHFSLLFGADVADFLAWVHLVCLMNVGANAINSRPKGENCAGYSAMTNRGHAELTPLSPYMGQVPQWSHIVVVETVETGRGNDR